MQSGEQRSGRGRKGRMRLKLVILAALLGILSGCITGGKVKPESVEADRSTAKGAAATQGSTVRRLDDGREGFAILEESPMDGEARGDFARAIALMNEGDFPRAVELLDRVIERSPRASAPHVNIAMAYRRMGKPEPAERHLQAALALVPGHPVASNEYGLLLRKAGRFAEARNTYEKALVTFPEYLPAHKNLGILCDLYLNDLACAIEQYEIYSAAMPDDEQIRIWIADLRLRLGKN